MYCRHTWLVTSPAKVVLQQGGQQQVRLAGAGESHPAQVIRQEHSGYRNTQQYCNLLERMQPFTPSQNRAQLCTRHAVSVIRCYSLRPTKIASIPQDTRDNTAVARQSGLHGDELGRRSTSALIARFGYH